MITDTTGAIVPLTFKTAKATTFGAVGIICFLVISGITAYSNTRTLYNETAEIVKIHQVIETLDEIFTLIKDAETGQRGFLITKDESYLEHYAKARLQVAAKTISLVQLMGNTPEIINFTNLNNLRFEELENAIVLRRTQGFQESFDAVATEQGQILMEKIRDQIGIVRTEQEDDYNSRLDTMREAYQTAIVVGIISSVLSLILVGFVVYLSRVTNLTRRREVRKQYLQVGLSKAMDGEQEQQELGNNILTFLAGKLNAQAGAIFVGNHGIFKQLATYGVPAKAELPEHIRLGEGIIGQAAIDNKMHVISPVPDGYLTLGSAFGSASPRHLVIFPTLVDGVVNSILELGFLHPVDDFDLTILESIASSIGVSVKSADYRIKQQNLLEQTQQQGEELQVQSEELRVANEELEQQGDLLRESQVQLEQQQKALMHSNDQLQNQTEVLETQRDDLEKTKAAVQLKAEELERSSQFKSNFLANMSHELRTPLNSLLILSKLLADNRKGNLSEEQVKFSTTIYSSGNNLLELINDILDLSKIEAGQMQIFTESVSLQGLLNDLRNTFEPLATQKSVQLEISISPQSPKFIISDRQRLEQVLRNLLSNAVKFTEKGKVSLTITATTGAKIAFTIVDTGIGIAIDEQQSVFEAFQQADGEANRQYGGTGLGLSISKELTGLLGGSLTVHSVLGEGSTFTLIVPEKYDQGAIPDKQHIEHAEIGVSAIVEARKNSHDSPSENEIVKAAKPLYLLEDDRECLAQDKTLILVVEDDQTFAKILYNLAHELNFYCLITSTAHQALILAKQYLPAAVLLDIGLPDGSGLTVLDQLKHDKRTRHIAVHIISAGDDPLTALNLGATSYLTKPVSSEQLLQAFKGIEAKLRQKVQRILVVEDNLIQRESIGKLLDADNIEIIGVASAAECLTLLENSTFDCMVLDLNLADSTGYELLETLNENDNYSYPPVIVYTGQELSLSDERKLATYSKSIIIKGAKSPERLLDEVTLFLHQVVSDLPPEQQAILEKSAHRNKLLKNRHILIVEDDVRNVYSLVSILEPQGVVLTIARNGYEALDALKNTGSKEKIDLVLMDVMMPGMDGITAVEKIRQNSHWQTLPIIMLTAKAMPNDRDKCLQAGASDYLSKPIDIDKLLSLLRVWMPKQ